jgi:hypothetical protein
MRLVEPEPNIISFYKLQHVTGLQVFYHSENNNKPHPFPRNLFYTPLKNILENIHWEKTHARGEIPYHSNYLHKITTPVDLKKKCTDTRYCLIAFFNSTDTEANREAFETQMPKLEVAKRNPRNEDIQFNWIDTRCHADLAAKFGITDENTPGVTFIYPWRSVYATFKGMWEPFIINEYIERSLSNRYESNEIHKDDIKLTNLQCEAADEEETEKTPNADDLKPIDDLNVDDTADKKEPSKTEL